MTRVEVREVVKDFGPTRVLHGMNLDIAPGELVSLLGPSGCGKTTALRILAGLENATSGAVLMDGADVSGIPTNRRDIGMVFQAYSLFPHLRARDNTAFGLRRRGVSRREATVRAEQALELVGLADLADRYPHQLSGGQQQRVALARALVTEPRLLLLDEPLSALDAKVRVQLREEIRRIQLRLGITTVFVTHDQEEALAISDRVAVMGDGEILQIGTPEDLYLRPVSAAVATFVGVSSLVPAQIRAGAAEVWGHRVPLLAPMADGAAEVFLRPENVLLHVDDGAGTVGVVQESTFLGGTRRTVVRLGDGTLVRAQHAASVPVAYGQQVRLELVEAPVAVRSR